jgi:hypothetical protein
VRHFYGNLSLNVQELGLVLDTEDEFPDIDFLEKLGIQWGFDDEYEECGECNHVIRTSPTNYGWRPDFWRSPSDGIICGACVRKDPEEYLDWLVNDPTRINVLIPAKELEDWGFRHLPEHYESGWHAGQDANPQQIFETLRQEHPTAEIIFHWEDAGQFDLHFSVYIRDGER